MKTHFFHQMFKEMKIPQVAPPDLPAPAERGPAYHQPVALIGCGPASMSCATFLARLGYTDIKVFENQFNQAEQDQQVQQVLAAGQLPDVFIWWPSDAVAGLGSLRALAKTGIPVLKINQLPNEEDKQYIFGYAGPDDRRFHEQ